MNLFSEAIRVSALLSVLLCLLAITKSSPVSHEEGRGSDGCGLGCQSLPSNSNRMSRCLRYACRRYVFRYYNRFGKRDGAGHLGFPSERERQHYLFTRRHLASVEQQLGLEDDREEMLQKSLQILLSPNVLRDWEEMIEQGS